MGLRYSEYEHGNEPYVARVGVFTIAINATCNRTWYPSVSIHHYTLVDGPPVPSVELAKEHAERLYAPFTKYSLEKAQAAAGRIRKRLYIKHRPDMAKLLGWLP